MAVGMLLVVEEQILYYIWNAIALLLNYASSWIFQPPMGCDHLIRLAAARTWLG
jgi:hypothetical protein